MFLDYVKIWVKSGKGGSGSVHFRREKFIPKGGPDGGNGGTGGNITIVGDTQLNTLLHLKYKKHIKADSGGPGQGRDKYGADAEDVLVKVPLGTVIKNIEKDITEAEITENGQEYIVAQGGKGGLGNVNFKSSTNQTPRYAQPGIPGVEKNLILELKILADVGLVGLPNAGKSTLLSTITAAKPKIGDYPFTTLVPSVGVVKYRDDNSFVMADIPGIIKGASQGKGLGTRFLRHIERNATLLFVIDATSDSIKNTYSILLNELKNHNSELLYKKKLLAITKSDLLDDELISEIIKKDIPNIDFVFISSLTNNGLNELKDKIWDSITANT